MLKYIFTIVFLIVIAVGRSQSSLVKSFRWIDPSLRTSIPSLDIDPTGKKYAIIKVENNQSGFDFDFGSFGNMVSSVNKADETLYWVKEGIQKVNLKNKQTGEKYDFSFGKELEASEIYLIVLNNEKMTTTVEKKIESKWLSLNSFPLGADITIDGSPAGQTPFYGSLSYGSHNIEMKYKGAKKTETIAIDKNSEPVTTLFFDDNNTINNDTLSNSLSEQNAEFIGGYNTMLKFIANNVEFPDMENKFKGTIYVQFQISETGRISDIKIIKGLSIGCDKEAIRLVKIMPKWKPKHIGGKAVPSNSTIQIKFNSMGILNEEK